MGKKKRSKSEKETKDKSLNKRRVTTSTPPTTTELVENGFEYVTEMDGQKLFRKRK